MKIGGGVVLGINILVGCVGGLIVFYRLVAFLLLFFL